jgi:UDP-4-amino-4,6-dideoxy-N-acetyl-beta-L-altrosamine transaminase
MKPIPYGRQQITEEDIETVVRVLRSDFLTQGPEVGKFEEAFAHYVGAKYAVAVANGTAALHLSALALEIQPGDKVITTPITFAATANCVRYCGGEVVFADIDPETYLLDVTKVRQLLEAAPRGTYQGVVPVDFAGYPANLEECRQLAEEFGLWVLEDACHAPGGWFTDSHGRRQSCGNGRHADAAVFSFHPVKHVAAGEGGMVTTNDERIYRRVSLLRTHGITKDPGLLREHHGAWYYEMVELGFNYRLTDMQAALACSQLARAETGLKQRETIAARYHEAFRDVGGIRTPSVRHDVGHAWHLYTIQTEDRLGLYNYLRENQILAQVLYVPTHLMPYYRQFGWKEGDCPAAEAYYQKCLSLPMYPSLTDEGQTHVIETVRRFFGR